MPRCDAISAGFDLCENEPIAQGIDDIIYLWNRGDFVFTFDPSDPLLITGITRVGGALMYKYLGTNNSFNTISKSKRTNVGPRYTEEIDFNIAGISSVIKNQIMAMGFGDLQCITVNNYRDGDSIFELFGAVNGLQDDGSERNASDENFGGGYNMKLTNRPKLSEPMMPRCVNIPIAGAALPGTVPVVPTSIQATGVPQNVVATGSAAGGALAAATYYYKIVSVDGNGTTLGSAEVNYVAGGTTSSVNLTWAAAPGATSYRIYRGVATNTQTLYYTSNTTSFLDTGAGGSASGTVPVVNTAIKATATPGSVVANGSASGGALVAATYYYVVTAVDSRGETLASLEVNYAASGGASSVTIEWGAVTGAVSYKVYRGTATGGENIFYQTAGLTFTDTGVIQAATYASTLAALEALCAA